MSTSDNVTTPLLKTTDDDEDLIPVERVLEDDEWGGLEARNRLEQGLLRKLDRRMSILVLIYILNYVSLVRSQAASFVEQCVCSRSDRPQQRSVCI